MPIVGDGVGAEYHQRTVGQLLLDRVAARQAGNPEEWGEVFLIPQRSAYIGDAAIDLGPNLVDRHLLHATGMMLSMRPYCVSFFVDASYDCGKFAGHFTDEKKRGFDALGGKDIEHRGGVGRDRSVVECEHNFLVGERQALRILHDADMVDFARVDDKNAARSQRVGMAGAVLRQGRGVEVDRRD